MPVNTPMVMEIDRKTWLIQEFGLDCCYALLGKSRGLLIDTGCGRMNIKRLAQRLFEGRPYDVVLTHGHGHHCGGAVQFDTVYCAEEIDNPVQNETLSEDFAVQQVAFEKKNTVMLPLCSGNTFDLGGREIMCIRTPGHSEGSSCFFDGQTGIAFVGDALGRHMKVECVSDALAGLMLLKRETSPLNRIYPGHVDYMDYRALPAKALDDAIGACRAALAPDGYRYHTADKQVVFRSVTLQYREKWAPMEPLSPYPIGI